MKNLVNGSNFVKYSDFIFSEIVSKSEFESLKEKNNDLIIIKEYQYLKLHAIWYVDPFLKLKDNDIIFSQSEVVDILFELLKNFSEFKNLKLITHQSDRAIDKRLYNKKPKNVKSWFSTNVDFKVDGLFSIPVGVNNFYNENFFNKKIQNEFFTNKKDFRKRYCLCKLHFKYNLKHRKKHWNLQNYLMMRINL